MYTHHAILHFEMCPFLLATVYNTLHVCVVCIIDLNASTLLYQSKTDGGVSEGEIGVVSRSTESMFSPPSGLAWGDL